MGQTKRKELEPKGFNSFSFWSGLLDSNQRPRAPQTCAQRYGVFSNPANFLATFL